MPILFFVDKQIMRFTRIFQNGMIGLYEEKDRESCSVPEESVHGFGNYMGNRCVGGYFGSVYKFCGSL